MTNKQLLVNLQNKSTTFSAGEFSLGRFRKKVKRVYCISDRYPRYVVYISSLTDSESFL